MMVETETAISREEERDLVKRSLSGDIEAFGRVVRAYETRIRLLIYGVVRDRQTADDLSQEAFIKAFRSLSRFRGKSSLFTWIYRIALNRALDYRRREKVRSWVEYDEARDSAVSPAACLKREEPSAPLIREEDRSLVRMAMDRLNPRHRTILILREWEGLNYRQISETMKCSVGTVMSRLFYARKQLKEIITAHRGAGL